MSIPQGLQAQVDPNIEWKEIETEDAYWLFDAKHQSLAEYYILQFKRAKAKVLPLFKEESRKITFVLLNNTDLANGSATVSPHPVVRLFTVQPLRHDSAIGEFKDYTHELVAHEYTHILNMEPVHGWIRPMYWIFGSIAHPNMILPRWYTEGLAVYTESLLSSGGGRLNSQYVEGLSRALTLEKKWHEYPIGDLNDFHPDWLGGSRAYIFGGMLWESLARENGTEIIEKFNQSYSRRIPYLLDGVIESYTQKNYQEQLKSAYDYWKSQSEKQLETISSEAHIDGIKLPKPQAQISSPSISPDGLWMVYIESSDRKDHDIQLTLRHPKKGFYGYKSKTVVEQSRAQSLVWHPAATGFVYEKINRYKRFNRYYDLYYYDLRTKKSRRLTRGERAHHSCFSPMGEKLFYLRNRAGFQQIVARDWQSDTSEVLYTSAIGEQLGYLTCGNNQSLYFVEHKPGQDRKIVHFDRTSKQKQIYFDQFPVGFIKNSHRGLLLTSPQSGVDNLYILNQENGQLRPQAITNSMTRVLDGDLDPLNDRLYISQITASGPQMYSTNGAQWESLPDSPPKVDPIAKFPRSYSQEAEPQLEGDNHKVADFSPWRYLYPNHWIPFLYLVDGGTLYQALTSAGDPLGINSLSLVGQWDTLTKKPGISASYVNRSLPISLGVGLSDIYNFFYRTRSTLHFTNASALMNYTFEFLDNTSMLFKWNYSRLQFGNNSFTRQGPQLEFSYRDLKQKRNDISPSEGWRFELGHKNFLADVGNISYGETYTHIGSFWSSFTPQRHVVYLGINASYAPQLTDGFFATSTLAGPFQNPQITNTSFLQRGYPTGIFIANNIVNTNLEYRFPLASIFRGYLSPPLFYRSIQASLVFDATTLDGSFSNSLTRSGEFTDVGRWFTGYGLELDSKVNVGFHVPITLTLGLYYGQDQESFGGFTTFFNIRL